MTTCLNSAAALRKLSSEELAKLGDDSLREHLLAQATVAHQKYAPFTAATLDAYLKDPACLRYPVRLVFEFGDMAMHQFAQPAPAFRSSDPDARVLYLRPLLREHPDLVILAVAFVVPVINYGDVVTDEHCLGYGATMLGLLQEEFYEKLCALADFVGTEVRYANQAM